ncbi:TonB-dependent receptor [uncultured Muribaculum sp.]|uniref:TonB-dependent receptor n=1 Tax=uncultured Muribaculum sp. TaxID=1918613 RepID=UPI0025B2333F|nr:TonB-dependent receptor [uncultured Muribaculum sp.]
MKRCILYVLAICTCAITSYSKNIVFGKVVSADSIGIEYASVRLLATDSTFITGATTDSNGKYTLELNKNGKYILQYSALGYNSKQINAEITKKTTILPATILEDNSKQLSEVTITGSRISRVDNHLLIIPDRMSVKHSFSAHQLLENLMLPGFEVNTQAGIVNLFNKGVSLYIDGQPADYNMVKNLRSRDVEKIEYHDVPSGRYSADYAAINFITRKYKFGGYANFDVQQCIGHLNGTYEGYAQIANDNTKYHVLGGYSMWNMSRDSEYSLETYKFPDNPVTREDRNLGGRTERYCEYGQIRVERTNQKNQFALQTSLVHSYNKKKQDGLLTYSSPYDIEEQLSAFNKDNALSPSFSGNAFFYLPSQQWISINGSIEYTSREKRSLYTVNDNSIPNEAKENYLQATAMVYYSKSFKHNNSLVAVIKESFKTSSINYSGSFNSWEHLWNSDLLALASYRHQIRKVSFSAQLGFILSQIRFHGNKLSTKAAPNTYLEFVYRPTKFQQLRANSSIGFGTTPLAYLTDGEIQSDFLNSRRGNPLLKRNMYYYNNNLDYSIQFGRFNAASSITYGWQDNAIFNFYYFDSDKLVQTFENGNLYYLTSMTSLSWNACKSFRMNLTGMYNHREIKSFQTRFHNYFVGKLNATYFWRDFRFNVSLATPFKTMTDWTTTKNYFKYDLNIAWNHKNWSISAWASNPFCRIKTTSNLDIPELNKYWEIFQSRSGMVKVTYTFDFGKKIQRAGVDQLNTSTGSAIL